MDDPNFIMCLPYFTSPQYYSQKFRYEGEMSAVKKEFVKEYDLPIKIGQNDFVTIRFVINCNGETGRYRIFEINKELVPYSFDKSIPKKLLEITRNLAGWQIQKYDDGTPKDYYQYLTFKIEDGLRMKTMFMINVSLFSQVLKLNDRDIFKIIFFD